MHNLCLPNIELLEHLEGLEGARAGAVVKGQVDQLVLAASVPGLPVSLRQQKK